MHSTCPPHVSVCVAPAEAHAFRPQVEDLKQSMAALHRERDEELGHSGDYVAHLAVRLQEREAEVHQLTQEVALCREEAAASRERATPPASRFSTSLQSWTSLQRCVNWATSASAASCDRPFLAAMPHAIRAWHTE